MKKNECTFHSNEMLQMEGTNYLLSPHAFHTNKNSLKIFSLLISVVTVWITRRKLNGPIFESSSYILSSRIEDTEIVAILDSY